VLTPSTVLIALLLDGPALWQTLVERTVPVHVALVRLLIALPVASLASLAVRTALRPHSPAQHGEEPGGSVPQAHNETAQREPAAARRATDRPLPDG
jgi:hypothetical protein